MAQLLRSVRNFFTRRAAPVPAARAKRYNSNNPPKPPAPTAAAIAEYSKLFNEFGSNEFRKLEKPITIDKMYAAMDRAKERIPRHIKAAAGKLEKNADAFDIIGTSSYTTYGGKRRKSRKLRRRS